MYLTWSAIAGTARSRARDLVVGGLVASLALASGAASAAAVTVLSFVPTSSEVNCNEIVSVDVFIDGGTSDLRGFTITIAYAAALLEVVDVLPGQLFVDAPCDPFLRWFVLPGGQLQIDNAGLGCSVAGPGAIARLRLRGLSDGISPLTGVTATLRNSANLSIDSNWTSGEVLVNCPVSAGGSSWGTVKGSYR